jgi:hypothetical protein
MVALAADDQSRCRFHLGFGNYDGIPAGDVARLEQAMNSIKDNYQLRQVVIILDMCDNVFANIDPTSTDSIYTKQITTGDINRANIVSTPVETYKAWRTAYLQTTDLLAQELWVPNYRQEGQMRYRFERNAGEYIMSIPGVADTSIGTKIYLWKNYI